MGWLRSIMIPYLDSQYKYISSIIIDPVKRVVQQVSLPDMPTLPHWSGAHMMDMFTRNTRSDASPREDKNDSSDDDEVFMERDPWLRLDEARAVREHFIHTPSPSCSASVSALGNEEEEGEETISNNESLPAFVGDLSSTIKPQIKGSVCVNEFDPSREREEILEGATTG